MTRFALRAALVIAAAALGLPGTARADTATITDVPQPLPTFDGPVYALTYVGNTIYLGGNFSAAIAGGHRYPRSRLAAIDAGTHALLPWAPTADNTVLALASSGGSVYLGGDFTTVDGAARGGLAQLDGVSGALGPFDHAVSGEPRALATGYGRLYVGGRLTAVDTRPVANLAAFSLATGDLDTGWAATASDRVDAVAVDAGEVYLGGIFSAVDAVPGTAKLAAVDPTSGARYPGFAPRVSVRVYAIAFGPSVIYAAFGGTGGRVMAFDPTGTRRWVATTDGDVQAVAYLDGVVYLGGHFDAFCTTTNVGVHGVCVDGSVPRVKLAAVDAGTGALLPWDPEANGIHGVFALASNPDLGTVAAGGEFTTLHGAWWPRFAQFAP